MLEERSIDLVLLDVWLDGIDGLETLERIRKNGVDPMVVMISGHASIETAVRATKLGAFDFIEKPLSLEKVILVIKNALEVHRLAQENRQLREELGGRTQLQGDTVPMRALRQQIALTAPTNGRVLIYGESGTGKELVARALARREPARRPGFRRSELRGDSRGADRIRAVRARERQFHRRDAKIKSANSRKRMAGRYFSMKSADMSLRTQSKVLRVLEEQRLEPVGSNQTVSVDVRVIAATNKTLEDEIAHGRFREDLFYRLNVIPFTLPPLRERIEDVPVLARYFMLEFAAAYGRKPKELSEAALGVMAALSLAGKRARIAQPDRAPHDRRPAGQDRTAAPSRRSFSAPARAWRSSPTPHCTKRADAYEREFILRKLEENQWHMTRTAEALGLERSHLYRRMRALGIKTEE